MSRREKRAVSEVELSGYSFVDDFMDNADAFLDIMSDEHHAKLNAHTTWHIDDVHEIISAAKVKTT